MCKILKKSAFYAKNFFMVCKFFMKFEKVCVLCTNLKMVCERESSTSDNASFLIGKGCYSLFIFWIQRIYMVLVYWDRRMNIGCKISSVLDICWWTAQMLGWLWFISHGRRFCLWIHLSISRNRYGSCRFRKELN